MDQTLSRIIEVSQEQLLYWHLSNTTNIYNYLADAVLLWNSDSYLWFLQVCPDQDPLSEESSGANISDTSNDVAWTTVKYNYPSMKFA